MKELRNVIALCRRDPEVGAILLLISACIYGMLAIGLAKALPSIDTRLVGQMMGGYVLPSTDAENEWIGQMTLNVGIGYLAVWGLIMAVAGVGLDIARRYGIVPSTHR